VLGVSALAGCRQGTMQVAFYLDEFNHYPKKGCDDDLWLLIKNSDPQFRYIYVEYQDVRLLRISVPQVDKEFYPPPRGRSKAYAGDRFHVVIEALLDPETGAAIPETEAGKMPRGDFMVRDSYWGETALKGVGRVALRFDDTNYGTARLDRAKIDFEAGFLHAARQLVAGPPEKVGGNWRFIKRREISVIVGERVVVGKKDYRCNSEKQMDPKTMDEPRILLAVTNKKVSKQTTTTVSGERWVEWPVNLARAGSAPAHCSPVSEGPEEKREKKASTESLGPEEPAATETILYAFELPGMDKKPDYLKDGTLTTDRNGRATLSLKACIPIAELPCEKLIVKFRAKDDPGEQWYTQEIPRTEFVPWLEKQSKKPQNP
jgi:hypothetical protein